MYPALAVLRALMKDEYEGEIQWVGGSGGMEADLVKRAGVPFSEIPAAGVHGVGMRALPGNLIQLMSGFGAARRLLRQFRPDVMFFTGGFVSVPVALAGQFPMKGVSGSRSLLYVPDIEPGLALRTLSHFADRLAVTTEDSCAFFPRHPEVTVTGYPTRRKLHDWNVRKALKVLRLSSKLSTLLVFGGSKGARSINRALLDVLPELLTEVQVIHISGQLDWPEVEAARDSLISTLPAEQVDRYRPYSYLHDEMGAALTVADIVLSRAGASTLGEFPLFGIPAILVPYPHAWRYQQVNAEYLAERGAAVIVDDADLPAQILPEVLRLLNNPVELDKMRSAMRALAQPQAAKTIANLIRSLASSRGGEQ